MSLRVGVDSFGEVAAEQGGHGRVLPPDSPFVGVREAVAVVVVNLVHTVEREAVVHELLPLEQVALGRPAPAVVDKPPRHRRIAGQAVIVSHTPGVVVRIVLVLHGQSQLVAHIPWIRHGPV